MASKKKPTNSTNPDKSGSKSKAKNGSGNDDKNEKEKRGKHSLQQLPTEAKPVLLEPFMKLPTEIRQIVYDFAVTEDQQPVLVDRWNVNTPYTRPLVINLPRLSTGLMGVCHKIQEEVGQRYYILNDFRFLQPSTLIDWLRDPNRRNQLRSIACRFDGNDTCYGISCEALRLLNLCASLVTLRIIATPADLCIFQRFEKFKALHGFARAEAIRNPADFPDDQYFRPPSIVNIEIGQRESQPILAQLMSRCPSNCTGHARRERMEIRVLPSGMRS